MNRYRNIPNIFKPNVVVDYLPETQHDETRIVDDTFYVPNNRANQILAKQIASNMLDNLAYDNPDDIRRGSVNVYARQKGRDLAELTQQMRALEKDVYDEVKRKVTEKTREVQKQTSQVPSSDNSLSSSGE